MASAKSRTIRAFSPQLWRLSPHLCGTVIPVFLSLIHQSRCQGAINKPRLESKIIVPNVSKRLVLPNTRGHFHPSKCFGCFSHLFLWFFSQCKAMRTGDGANSDIVTSISSPPFAPRLNHFAQEHIINVVVGRGAISSEASPGRSCDPAMFHAIHPGCFRFPTFLHQKVSWYRLLYRMIFSL